MKVGNRIQISGEAGTAIGKVLDIRPPNALPELAEGPPVELATRILMEWHIVRLAVIQVAVGGYIFMALEVDGCWFDLHQRKLQIEVL